MNRNPRQIVDIDPEELRRLYITEGLTIEKTAERFNVSTQTIKTVMSRYDIPRRPKGPRKGTKQNRAKEEIGVTEPEQKQVAAVAGIKCTDAVMKTCMYANTNGAISCDYIGVTGHMRGCSPDHCTRYKKQEGTRRKGVAL